ncbi:MAG: hypothetical protein LBQ01_03985, partial [Prevotellaceae bacterium]|nr:hypothetical protein [Prevotellaceae bacterium]
YFFKHNSIKDEFTAKGLDRVRETLLYENLTDEEKQEYKRIADVNLQNKNVIYTAECEGEMRARLEYEPKLAHEREEKEAALATLAREREEKEAVLAALAREREEKDAILAKLDALKNNK